MLSRKYYEAIGDIIRSSPLLLCTVEGEEREVEAVELEALVVRLAAYFLSDNPRFSTSMWRNRLGYY